VQNAPESGMRSGPGALDTFTHARGAGGIPQPRTLLTPTRLKRSQSFETSANCQAAGRTTSKGPAQGCLLVNIVRTSAIRRGGHPSATPFIVAERWFLLRRRATCSPDLTSLRATLFAGCTPRRTSFHPACASPLTPLRSGLWASRRSLGWRRGRRRSLCLSL